ncbi:ABC transporter permease [Amycolatopsis cihanbeyliensis]|uniref:Transport permease protein n=1 Tax=Amycolatopsis cihanbeyliensis TaxID=1128664 RepID=A0A542DK75_AMYCI|nr:ABC transporter permease [Amycolatopsis cihanbeyliensis]TQJ03501.1 ABC-2 type transport system permease protein [Amycolatopsis cihanbeyliensis]
MNNTLYVMRLGVGRGWLEFVRGLRSPQDIGFYVVLSAGILTYLLFNRNEQVEGTSLSLPAVAMPSILGGLVIFGGTLSAAYALATEREDGTLLRFRAIPHGMAGFLTGHVVRTSLEAIPTLAVLVIPGLFLFDGLMYNGIAGWLSMLILLLLGLVIAIPFGTILGSLVKGPQQAGTWGLLPIMAMVAISGILYPIVLLPDWVQFIAQLFPVYWLGLGMRAAFLPDGAVVAEIGESWRHLETVGVLGVWALLGLLLAPVILRRMARRESGARVLERRERALQRVS